MRKKTYGLRATLIFLGIAALPCYFFVYAAVQNRGPASELEIKYQNLEQLWEHTCTLTPSQRSDLQPELDRAFHQLIDFKELGLRVIGRNREKFSSRQKVLIQEAVTVSVKREAMQWYEAARSQGCLSKDLVKEKNKPGESQLTYNLHRGRQTRRVKVFAGRNPEGEWKVIDIESSGGKLSDVYRRRIRRLHKDYSMPGILAELKGDNVIVIDDFSRDETGAIPRGWRWQDKDNDEDKHIRVQLEGENKYINLVGKGHSVIFGKVFKWNLSAFPYISWRWRIHALPEGGDERFNKTNDSAAAVYIVYSKNLVGVPTVVKYVWSTTLPPSAATRRKGIGRPWSVVARSGNQGMGIWHTEVFNAVAAYRATFGKNPPKNAIGLAILTDANSTKSLAEADYDDFKLLRQAAADSGVKQILKGGK